MTGKLSEPVAAGAAAEDPVTGALRDPLVNQRLLRAALAFLPRAVGGGSPRERLGQAEELVQETRTRAWKIRDRFDAARDVTAWMVGILRKVLFEHGKRQARWATQTLAQGNDLETLAVVGGRPIEDQLADRQLADFLLDQLPPDEQRLVRMKFFEQRTHEEISRQLGKSIGAVRVWLSRILTKLRQQGEHAGEGQP